MSDLQMGELIELTHGPFASTWRVVEIIDVGARLAYCGDVRFTGYRGAFVAPNETPLTSSPRQEFLGRAHWATAKRIQRVQSTQHVRTVDEERRQRAGACVGGGMHAWREHGNPATGAPFSACIACGVSETEADYTASGRRQAVSVPH